LGLTPMARFVSFAAAGVEPEYMGIGPIAAIPKALKLAGLELSDIDLFELNEAFAAQALAVARTVGIPLEKLNVNGGAIALGHPLGATGAKLTATIIHELRRRRDSGLGGRYGMVTMCVGGGQGAAGIFELLN
jgi:acetyl-CoA acyltransferase